MSKVKNGKERLRIHKKDKNARERLRMHEEG